MKLQVWLPCGTTDYSMHDKEATLFSSHSVLISLAGLSSGTAVTKLCTRSPPSISWRRCAHEDCFIYCLQTGLSGSEALALSVFLDELTKLLGRMSSILTIECFGATCSLIGNVYCPQLTSLPTLALAPCKPKLQR